MKVVTTTIGFTLLDFFLFLFYSVNLNIQLCKMKDKKLTILFITEYLPPQINGIAIRCYNFIKNFRKLGHVVHIAGPDTSPLTTIPMYTLQNDVFNKGNKLCFLDIDSITNITLLLTQIDIVHVFYPINISSSILFPFFKLHNIPVICSHHCDPSQTINF